MNKSLTKFRNFRKITGWGGLGLIILGPILYIAGLTATSSIGEETSWISPSDTFQIEYLSESDCSDAGYNDCEPTSSDSVAISNPNIGLMILSYVMASLGVIFISATVVASFLIITSESIIEGLGGNVSKGSTRSLPKSTDAHPVNWQNVDNN